MVNIILNNATYRWTTCYNQILLSSKGETSLFSLHSFLKSIRINIWVISNPLNRWFVIPWFDVVLPNKILSKFLFCVAFLKLLPFSDLVLWLTCWGRLFGSQMEYNLNLGFPLALVFKCATYHFLISTQIFYERGLSFMLLLHNKVIMLICLVFHRFLKKL